MKLIVGLGNPGRKYQGVRHNVGFAVVERVGQLIDRSSRWEKRDKFQAEVWRESEGKCLLAKPLTFMNRSGEAVGKLARFYRVETADIWVVYDDIELPTGEIKIQPVGRRANHRGVQSVVEMLGTGGFGRFRVGVGWDRRWEKEAWVLGRFKGREKLMVEGAVEKMAGAILLAVAGGIDLAMNRVN